MTIFLILGIIAALYVVWLIFRAAAYALPVYAGIALGLHLVDTGHGHGTAILAGFGCGIAVLLLGQLLVAFLPSTALRLVVVAIFTVPAAFAGYQVGIGFGGQLIGQGTLLTLTSVLSGLVAALSAWRSLALPVGADGGATPRSGGSSAPPPASAD
jgi:hypothetical protein